ncbi:hypothetical protein HanIR_Chr17g0877451 [Helianthus annuus]|nr:hypothetical protein HanIR_Chr17g0877451 [Helianthus annuus]
MRRHVGSFLGDSARHTTTGGAMGTNLEGSVILIVAFWICKLFPPLTHIYTYICMYN